MVHALRWHTLRRHARGHGLSGHGGWGAAHGSTRRHAGWAAVASVAGRGRSLREPMHGGHAGREAGRLEAEMRGRRTRAAHEGGGQATICGKQEDERMKKVWLTSPGRTRILGAEACRGTRACRGRVGSQACPEAACPDHPWPVASSSPRARPGTRAGCLMTAFRTFVQVTAFRTFVQGVCSIR